MADKKDKGEEKRGTGETARRIWLAGIGAYGRAFTEAQEALKDVTGKSSEVFDDLVQKGEMIETLVGMKSKQVMDKAGVPDINIDERIQKMRDRLKSVSIFDGGDDDDAPSSDLEGRVTAIEAKLDMILKKLDAKPARKGPATKKATKTVRTPKPKA